MPRSSKAHSIAPDTTPRMPPPSTARPIFKSSDRLPGALLLSRRLRSASRTGWSANHGALSNPVDLPPDGVCGAVEAGSRDHGDFRGLRYRSAATSVRRGHQAGMELLVLDKYAQERMH